MQISKKQLPDLHLAVTVRLWVAACLSRFERMKGLLALTCFLALVLPLLSGCERCSSDVALATLSAKEGKVDRDTASEMEKWGEARVGATFAVGDGVRTGKKAGAQLTLDDGSVLGLEE